MTDREHARELKKLKGHLNELTLSVTGFILRLDHLMKAPLTIERGKAIAALTNDLDMANDQARYFGLGIDYRTDEKKVST